MTVDVAGPNGTAETTDPRISYLPAEAGQARAAYPTPLQHRGHLAVRHEGDQIVVRDPRGGVEGTGATHLDALRAFQAARGEEPDED